MKGSVVVRVIGAVVLAGMALYARRLGIDGAGWVMFMAVVLALSV